MGSKAAHGRVVGMVVAGKTDTQDAPESRSRGMQVFVG
jgi:hypothetical protein